MLQDVFGQYVPDIGPFLPPGEHLAVEVVGMEMRGKHVKHAGPLQQAVVHDAFTRNFFRRIFVIIDNDRYFVRLDGETAMVDIIKFHVRE